MSVAAPVVAADIGIPASSIGIYTSIVYGLGAFSAMLSPGFVLRFGAIRISQFSTATALAGIAAAAFGTNAALLALSAALLGSGYGSPATSSSHLLSRYTPPESANLIYSIRQSGVPLGGMLAGLLVPPLLLQMDWRQTLLLEAAPLLFLLVAMEPTRRGFDADRDPTRRLFNTGLFRPLRLIGELPALRWLSLAAFLFTGFQLTFSAFLVTFLHERVKLDVLTAGQIVAVYQVTGVVSRPILGWMADHVIPARSMLIVQGLGMAVLAAIVTRFTPDWPVGIIMVVAVLAGLTAGGTTGLSFAEFTRIGGRHQAAMSAGTATFVMFMGVAVMPASFSVLVETAGGYDRAFTIVGGLAGLGALLLWWSPGTKRQG
jgi:MFS family permease